MSAAILCLDLGGSKLAWGLMRPKGRLHGQGKKAWQFHSADDVLEQLIPVIEAALGDAGEVAAIGMTIPGPCDPVQGLWLSAGGTDIHDFPIARLLGERLRLPVFAENDARACALAEQRYGAGQRVADFLYLTVSNGIGGGIISGGQLLCGAGQRAGEIGHVTVVPEGRYCACGKKGCLQAYAAGPGISQSYFEMTGKNADGRQIAALADDGQEFALRAWAMEGEFLGRGIAMAANLLNPSLVILGGGLSLAYRHYERTLSSALTRNLFPGLRPIPRILSTPFGYDGGLYAAASLALRGLNT